MEKRTLFVGGLGAGGFLTSPRATETAIDYSDSVIEAVSAGLVAGGVLCATLIVLKNEYDRLNRSNQSPETNGQLDQDVDDPDSFDPTPELPLAEPRDVSDARSDNVIGMGWFKKQRDS